MGDIDGALARHREALKLREQTFGPTHPEVALSLNSIGNMYFFKNDFAGALTWYERVLAVREASLGADSSLVASALYNLGIDLISLHRNLEGREKVAKALALYETSLGKDSPRLVLALTALGHVEVDLGAPAEARRHLERALAILGAREDDMTALTRFNLARAVRGEHGDERRARELALESKRYYERRKDANKTLLEQIDDWLKGPRSM